MIADIWSFSLESSVSPLLFSCTGEIGYSCCLNPHIQTDLLLSPFFFSPVPLKLFVRLLSWNYWNLPLGIPVLHCESLKGSRDKLLLFGTYCSFFNTLFPECLPCGNSPALGWKAISYFLTFLCQHYLGLWLMVTSVIICDFPPTLTISTQSTEWYSSIHSSYEYDIWDSWRRVLRKKMRW